MDNYIQLQRLLKIHSDITKRQYPDRMRKDKELILHALEELIFARIGEVFSAFKIKK